MVFNNKKFGFTLSEVMITISLIGVLATLTVSTIGSSIQQRTRTSEFRTAYARLETALKNVTIDDGKIYRCYALPTNKEKGEFGLNKVNTISAQNNDCDALEDAFSRALGRIKTCATKPQTNGCIPKNYPQNHGYFVKDGGISKAYVMDNGMILWVGTGGISTFAVDINGRSAPNKWGQDIFPFMIKVTETKTIGENTFPVSLGILPPTTIHQPAVSGTGKTTAQMMKEMVKFKD
jgi:prepilin-type N-terminal cleavage/methylation domain-containing protein